MSFSEGRIPNPVAVENTKQLFVDRFNTAAKADFPDSLTVSIPSDAYWNDPVEPGKPMPDAYYELLHSGYYVDKSPSGNNKQVILQKQPTLSILDLELTYNIYNSQLKDNENIVYVFPYTPLNEISYKKGAKKEGQRMCNYIHRLLGAQIAYTDEGSKVWMIPSQMMKDKTLFYRSVIKYIQDHPRNKRTLYNDVRQMVTIPDNHVRYGEFNQLYEDILTLGINLDEGKYREFELTQVFAEFKFDQLHPQEVPQLFGNLPGQMSESNEVSSEEKIEFSPVNFQQWESEFKFRQIQRLLNLAGFEKADKQQGHGFINFRLPATQ